jgi:hypothetical protein
LDIAELKATMRLYHWTFFITTALVLGACSWMVKDFLGWKSPWLGLLVMLNFMGLAKVGEPLFVLRLPLALRAVRAWEREDAAYGRLGVRHFGRLLRDTPLRYLNTSVYLSKDRRDLAFLYRHAASAEATHFWAAVAFTPYIVWVFVTGHIAIGLLFVAIQMLFHLYPVLHLRMLRGRLDRTSARALRKQEAIRARA